MYDIENGKRLAEAARKALEGVPDEEWAVDPDEREGMEWNFHIVRAGTDDRICFMANFGDDDLGGRYADLIAYACSGVPALAADLELAHAEIERLIGGIREAYQTVPDEIQHPTHHVGWLLDKLADLLENGNG